MGLDLLEFTLGLEKSFGITIPDADVARLKTARDVATYVEQRLGPLGPDRCATQQAFYTLRRAATQAFNTAPREIGPSTEWHALFGQRPRADWTVLRNAVGSVQWPRYAWGATGPTTRTVGQTAAYLAVQATTAVRRREAPWSRREIEYVIRGLAAEELDIPDLPWDAEFIRDLGCG